MIIVSQDKKEIINFDRITEIATSENNICITDSVEQKNGYIIATYETKTRAMEVIREIIEQYKKQCEDTYFIVYEMPED